MIFFPRLITAGVLSHNRALTFSVVGPTPSTVALWLTVIVPLAVAMYTFGIEMVDCFCDVVNSLLEARWLADPVSTIHRQMPCRFTKEGGQGIAGGRILTNFPRAYLVLYFKHG
jgi:hypothetical protein